MFEKKIISFTNVWKKKKMITNFKKQIICDSVRLGLG